MPQCAFALDDTAQASLSVYFETPSKSTPLTVPIADGFGDMRAEDVRETWVKVVFLGPTGKFYSDPNDR